MKENEKNSTATKWALARRVGGNFSVTALTGLYLATATFATGNEYAKNAAEWVLDGAFWLFLALGIGSAAMALVKRNTTAGIITLIATAVICYLCSNPTAISTLGSALAGIIGL